MHIQRKDALDFDDMTAIATVGAHGSLRSGVTTVGDCSFSGATALAAASSGLRAIVYLEVFSIGADPLDRFHEAHARIEHAVSDRVRVGVSPHAPYTCTLEIYQACSELGFPRQRISPRAPPSATGSSTAPETGAPSHDSWCRLRERPGFACWRPKGCSALA